MMTEEQLKEGKKARRNAKGTLTRTGSWLTSLVEAKRPETEVRDALAKIEASYNELVIKHDDYIKLIDDDALFEAAEDWMDECQGSYMNYVMRAKSYLESLVDQSDKDTTPPNPPNMIGISSVQSDDDVVSGDQVAQDNPSENKNGVNGNDQDASKSSSQKNEAVNGINNSGGFKME